MTLTVRTSFRSALRCRTLAFVARALSTTSLETLVMAEPAADEQSSFTGSLPDAEYVASYNLHDSASGPTITTPGLPPKWKNRRQEFQMQDRSWQRLAHPPLKAPRDAVFKKYPLLASFISADVADAKIDWSSVDYVTTALTMYHLLTHINAIYRRQIGDYRTRYALELAGARSVAIYPLLRTSEDKPQYFVDKVRQELVDPILGMDHYRVTKTNFFGLNLLLSSRVGASHIPRGIISPELASTVQPVPTSHPDIQVQRGGVAVPQESLISLRLHPFRHQTNLAPPLIMSYFGSIPNVYATSFDQAAHRVRTFLQVDLRNEHSTQVRARQADVYSRLAGLLRLLQSTAIKYGPGAKLEVVLDRAEIRIYQREDDMTLIPEEMRARFQ